MVAISKAENCEYLSMWISKFRNKRKIIKRNRKQDLLAQSIITAALQHAEVQLRTRQQENLLKWRSVRRALTHAHHLTPTESFSNQYCEELKSFEEFMSNLNSVKVQSR